MFTYVAHLDRKVGKSWDLCSNKVVLVRIAQRAVRDSSRVGLFRAIAYGPHTGIFSIVLL